MPIDEENVKAAVAVVADQKDMVHHMKLLI